MAIDKRTPLREELASLINRNSLENGSNTPDFILAEYLLGCLDAFNKASVARTHWYGHAVRENNVLECNVPGLPDQSEKPEPVQLVPIEPTPEMLKALRENEGENAWLAALAVAPKM